MNVKSCQLEFNFKKTFTAKDATFKKLFDEAVKAKPSFLAFDIGFDYAGLEGEEHGIQIDPDTISEGNYICSHSSDGNFILEASCIADVELIFFSDKHQDAFESAVGKGKIVTSIKSICNNGQKKDTYWSMECDPHIAMDLNEIQFKL